jgi:hypothetical protein
MATITVREYGITDVRINILVVRIERKELGVEQRYAITVKFLVDADSAEDAEEMVETACEKASASFPEMSYEGIEDIEEEEEG